MRFWIIIFAFTLVDIVAHGQAGYMGKRMYTKYNFATMPALLQPTYNRGTGNSTLRFNTTHSGTWGIVVSNRRAIEIGAGWGRTSFINNHANMDTYDSYSYGNQGYSYGETPQTKISFFRFDVSWVAYANRGVRLAPIGVYSAYSVTLLQSYVREQFEGQDFYFYDKINSLLFSYFIGNRRILFDKVLIDYSVGSALNLSIVASSVTSDKNYYSLVQQRIFNLNFLQAKVGIGLIY